jgi:hypothetical protein
MTELWPVKENGSYLIPESRVVTESNFTLVRRTTRSALDCLIVLESRVSLA